MKLEFWKSLEQKYNCSIHDSDIKLSIIIPVCNSAVFLGQLLYDIASQNYSNYEIIIVDAASKDRTLEVAYRSNVANIKTYSVAKYNYYEMLNRGIALAEGDYIQFIKPEDTFLSINMFGCFLNKIDKNKPQDLIYSACATYSKKNGYDFISDNLDLKSLSRGNGLTNLSFCWFKASLFRDIGRFDVSFVFRADYDLFCRLYLNPNMNIESIKRAFIDSRQISLSHSFLARYYIESIKIIRKYFGNNSVLLWLIQKRFIRDLFIVWKQKIIAYVYK